MIIDHFEKQSHISSALPETPKQKIVSLLFDVMGLEGLMRPAMHYRWNYREENDYFLEQGFSTLFHPRDGDPKARLKVFMDELWQACRDLGATQETSSAVESAYEELLVLLNKHFSIYPYLLGGKPSIADFGLIAPFYGHLSRDPYPSMLMKKSAFHVFRWTERMNRSESDMGEYPTMSETFIENDHIPETLKAILSKIGEDFVPESLAVAEFINRWIESNNPVAGEPLVKRNLGMIEFDFRGVKVRAPSQPWRFFLLARMQKAYAELTASDQQSVKELLTEMKLDPLLSLTIKRDIKRHDHLEVWG